MEICSPARMTVLVDEVCTGSKGTMIRRRGCGNEDLLTSCDGGGCV